MKPLSERDENYLTFAALTITTGEVGMKPLSERDENRLLTCLVSLVISGT